MQSSAWFALLRHIPAEQHDQYMLVTVSGTEIAIQGLLLIEQEFVALKGRLSGSQEAGRVFFIPYAQIDYFGTQKPIKDTEFAEVFGSLVVPDGPYGPDGGPDGADQEMPLGPSSMARNGSGPRPVIRSEVLERYRSRPSSAAILPNTRPTP
jgi:hypothetical protein